MKWIELKTPGQNNEVLLPPGPYLQEQFTRTALATQRKTEDM